jgi:hypothetical protein
MSEVRYSEVGMSTPNIVRKHNQQNRRMYNSHSEISFHYDEKYIRFQNFFTYLILQRCSPSLWRRNCDPTIGLTDEGEIDV